MSGRLRSRVGGGKTAPWCRWLAGAALLLWLSPVASGLPRGETEVAERTVGLLREAFRAGNSLSYSGTLMYRYGARSAVLHISRGSDEQGWYQRLFSLEGGGKGMERGVCRNHLGITSLLNPRHGVVLSPPGFREEEAYSGTAFAQTLDVQHLLVYYRFRPPEQRTLAGRSAWLVEFRPRDAFRYGWRFWIDRASSLLLGLETFTRDGTPGELVQFMQVEISPQATSGVPSQPGPSPAITTYNTGLPATGPEICHWRFDWLPPGFRLTEQGRRHLEIGPVQVMHFLFTDSLVSVSVFIEDIAQAANSLPPGPLHISGLNAYVHKYTGHYVTALGQLPVESLQRIVETVRNMQPESESGSRRGRAPTAPTR